MPYLCQSCGKEKSEFDVRMCAEFDCDAKRHLIENTAKETESAPKTEDLGLGIVMSSMQYSTEDLPESPSESISGGGGESGGGGVTADIGSGNDCSST